MSTTPTVDLPPGAKKRFAAPELSSKQNLILAIVVLALAAIVPPLMFDSGGTALNIAVLGAAYTVMALGLNIIVAAAYWLVSELTLIPTTPAGRVTPMWPAAGIAVE